MSPVLKKLLRFFCTALFFLGVTFPLHAEILPEGLVGVTLGQTREAALSELIQRGVVRSDAQIQCIAPSSGKLRNAGDRICKITVAEGTTYNEQPVQKISILLNAETVVLVGLELGSGPDSFQRLIDGFTQRLGAPEKESRGKVARWGENVTSSFEHAPTVLQIWQSDATSLLVYSFGNAQ